MLNFVEISNRIDRPELIKLEDMEGLRQLAERYPFTALFSQLYLKGLAMHNTIKFEAELKNHAYRIPDRTQLFHMVHLVDEVQTQVNVTESDSSIHTEQELEQSFERIEKAQDEIESEILVSSNNEVIQEEIESPKVAPISEESIQPEPVVQEINEEKVKEESVEESSTEKSILEDNNEERKNNLKNVGDLERDILAHAISSSIYMDVDKELEDTYSFARLKRLDEPKEFEKEAIAIQFDFPRIEADENLQSERALEEGKEDKIFKTFTAWMNTSDDEKKSKSISKKDVEIAQLEEEKSKIEQEKEKNKEISVVEKRKSEFFSPLQKARESLDETRLPVSETLAKVYAAQGNYPKAIVAYEKLILKFPEKKSFFALQIETLKRKLN